MNPVEIEQWPAPLHGSPLPLRSWLLLAAIALLIGTLLGFLT